MVADKKWVEELKARFTPKATEEVKSIVKKVKPVETEAEVLAMAKEFEARKASDPKELAKKEARRRRREARKARSSK